MVRIDHNSGPASFVSNLQLFNDAINTVRPTGLLAEEISKLDTMGIPSMILDQITLNRESANEIREAARQFLLSIATICKALEVLVPIESPDSIHMLLPPTQDVFTLSENLSKLCRVFEPHVIHPNIGGKISIHGWENGSFWVEIIVGTQAAVTIVAAIASASVVILKKSKEAKIFGELVNGLKIRNDSVSDISMALQEQLKILTKELATRIASENLRSSDPEDIKRLELSIRSLSELIEKGTEVHPALMAPEDIRHLFPHKKELPSSKGPLTLPTESGNRIPNDGDEEIGINSQLLE